MAGGVISTGSHPKSLWPGVHGWFGRAYDEYEPEYKDLVDIETSDKAYEEEVETTGFGLASVKPQGRGFSYDTDSQGYTARYTHLMYASGYIVTEEELEDNLYAEVSKRRAPDLAYALRQTKENVVALIYGRAFNSAFTGGDGVSLINASHPTLYGNQSNLLANNADISEAAFEDIAIQIGQARNARGLIMKLRPESLHIAVAQEFEAGRILKSVLQNDTALNSINMVRVNNTFPGGAKVNHYFTSDSAWHVRTNVRHGLKLFQRRSVKFERDNDFDTSNAKAKATERYSVGWSDWRALFSSPGV
jgi:hypothetical protein